MAQKQMNPPPRELFGLYPTSAMPEVGAINAWHCSVCGENTICIHTAIGTTPMFIGCRATPGCSGRAVSMMYDTKFTEADAEWEWCVPSTSQLKMAKRENLAMHNHFSRGGLMLKKRDI